MIRFLLGEIRTIKFMVHSTKGDDFTIQEASWTLDLYGVQEAGGKCRVFKENGKNYLLLDLEPEKTGMYVLEITFKVGTETLKERIGVEVK